MKKLLCAVLACVLMMSAMCFGASAEDATSLLPADPTAFTCVDGGEGSVSVAKDGDVFKFTATGGWPQAYYMGTEDTWAKAYVNQECYLNWDFEVVSGGANVIVFFCGQNPMDKAGAGVGETINFLIDPANKNLASEATVDLPVGKYNGSIAVKDLGCREDLMVGEGAEQYFTVSGIKVFAVGGEVLVNDLSVGAKKGDVVEQPDTTVKVEDTLGDLAITLTANKPEYKADETIMAALSVQNVGNADVQNVNLESVIPEGYALAQGGTNTLSVEAVKPGEYATVSVSFEPKAEETTTTAATTTTVAKDTPKQDSPKTGDTSDALLALVIAAGAAAAMVLCFKTRGGKQMLSIVLCLTLSFAMVAAVPTLTDAAEESGAKTLSLTVKVDGKDVVLEGKVAYGEQGGATTTSNVTTTTKAPLEFSVEYPEFPVEVKTFNYAGTHTATCTVDSIAHEVDASGVLALTFNATKTFDSKGNDRAGTCKIKYEIYDSQNNLVYSGSQSTEALKVGQSCAAEDPSACNAHKALTELTPVHGEAYRFVLVLD